MSTRHLQLYITTESPCSYFDDRMHSNLVPDPHVSMNMSIYNQLIQHGFRRSGEHSYRPYCSHCGACIACRIPVYNFRPNRSQLRCMKVNEKLIITAVTATYSDEYFELYHKYLNARHGDGSMANPSKEDFEHFLFCDWCHTQFLEFRENDRLVAIAVTDIISDGVSAVYSFFDPGFTKRSLGTYCILQQVNYARELGLDYVYLGYWIDGHPKMEYKTRFRPLQLYLNEKWTLHSS